MKATGTGPCGGNWTYTVHVTYKYPRFVPLRLLLNVSLMDTLCFFILLFCAYYCLFVSLGYRYCVILKTFGNLKALTYVTTNFHIAMMYLADFRIVNALRRGFNFRSNYSWCPIKVILCAYEHIFLIVRYRYISF